MSTLSKEKKPPRGLRTVVLWARYDPRSQTILETAKYKYELPMQHRDSPIVTIRFKGHYVRRAT